MHDKVEDWCSEELKILLGSSASEEIVKYVLSIQSEEEVEEFLGDLLGSHDANVRKKFVSDLRKVRHNVDQDIVRKQGIDEARKETQSMMYRKPPHEEIFSSSSQTSTVTNQGGKNKHKSKKNRSLGEEAPAHSHVMLDPLLADKEAQVAKDASPSGGTKQRRSGNFVPLYDHVGQSSVILLPGRHPCSCQASKHSLINNCIQCGRIVCKQEGSGTCFTCSAVVCTPEEQEVLRRGSKKSERLYNQLTSAPDDELLRRAVEHKNKLLDYNITSAQRTKVIDDECDYFTLASDKWISKEEREKLLKKAKEQHEKKNTSRFGKGYTIKLDYAGRTVPESDSMAHQSSTALQELQAGLSQVLLKSTQPSSNGAPDINLSEEQDVHPTITVPPPMYEASPLDPNNKESWKPNVFQLERNATQMYRLQDRELQELSDQGLCLSMHQPWASLLVRGIKMHEGRTWYTVHRGPLWIHSGSKLPTKPEIAEAENFYRLHMDQDDLDFPKQYPVSCLLGCVNVVDCLPQEEYRQLFPGGESMSPYVFICEDPQEMIVKIPMAGKHKIFRLDQKIHQSVKKTLRKLNDKKFQ